MYSKLNILEQGKKVIDIEIEALAKLRDTLNGDFEEVVELLSSIKGKVFMTGVGKSGLIARKVAATMSSTGTPTVFIHATDFIHGDVGVISEGDVGVLFSYSGETDELTQNVPILKRMGITVVGIAGKKNSTLARSSDYFIHIPVDREACPMGIVPTASTTAMLALGDAIAVALLIKKGFTENDFAKLHPGGALGRKLLVRVCDIMHPLKRVPLINSKATMRDALIEITSKSLGITGVVDDNGYLVGAITDGDLRRHMEKSKDFLNDNVGLAMGKNPKIIKDTELAVNALNKMEEYKITHIFVVAEADFDKPNKKVVGLLHIHNILGAKIL